MTPPRDPFRDPPERRPEPPEHRPGPPPPPAHVDAGGPSGPTETTEAGEGGVGRHRGPEPARGPAVRRGARPVSTRRKVVNAVLGLALVGAAVAAQTRVLTADQLNDPLTAAAGFRDPVVTDRFHAQLERVEFARSVAVKKQYGTDTVTAREIFLIAKVGAIAPREHTQLTVAFLVTRNGRRFEQTEKVDTSATLGAKYVQPGWWRSGFYFFDVPASAVPGSRIVLQEKADPVFGDQYVQEASFGTELDEATARKMIGEAEDVYEVTG